jgi:hypothetical protein
LGLRPLAPTLTAHLFPPLHTELVALLSLTSSDWDRPTAARAWRVRDVAAHLLDGDLRRLSIGRDGHRLQPDHPIAGNADLVEWLNALNAEWLRAFRRVSPRLLIELLALTGPSVAAMFAALPPGGRALLPVGWAGDRESPNWLDVGREYTERWHHQMQIRDAVGAPGLTERRWMDPVLELSVRALPHAYGSATADAGTAIVLVITDQPTASWSVLREPQGWTVMGGEAPDAAASVRMEADTAWRLFFNGLQPAEARSRLEIRGDASLAEPLIAARAVMV